MPPGLEKPAYDYCDVSNFPALPDHVYRNDGGRFVDVTQQRESSIRTDAGWV